jgi:hypothetical protein
MRIKKRSSIMRGEKRLQTMQGLQEIIRQDADATGAANAALLHK